MVKGSSQLLEKPETSENDAGKQNFSFSRAFKVQGKDRYQSTTTQAANDIVKFDRPHGHMSSSYQHGSWTQDPEDMLLGHNDYVNDSARLYSPFDDTEAALKGKNPLYKSLGGRLLTQTVARGLTGAAFFAVGSYMIDQYKPGADMQEQTWLGKPLRAVESLLNWSIAKPVEHVLIRPAYRISGNDAVEAAEKAKKFLTFNQSAAKEFMVQKAQAETNPTIMADEVFGHTWAQEMVLRTWSFAAGSIGAAVGRNAVSIIDPHHKTSWINEGKIDIGDMIKSSAKEFFQIMTYNQMEDWFAAPMYTLQLRAMRQGVHNNGLFNKTESKNSAMWDMEAKGTNGNTRRVSINGDEGSIGDSFSGAIAFDYQSRFMLYNYYTLIFRDLYNHLFKNHVGDECAPALEAPEDPVKSIGHNASETAKYLIKSLVKSQIYMAPAVMAFWPQRVGGAKNNHAFVDEATGQPLTTVPTMIYNPDTDGKQLFVQTQENGDKITFPYGSIMVDPKDMNAHMQDANAHPIYRNENKIQFKGDNYDVYEAAKDSFLGKGTNIPGKVTDGLHKVSTPVFEAGVSGYSKVKSQLTGQPTDDAHIQKVGSILARKYASAAISYLPYMTAKYETANMWDTPVMDAAAYRMADGLFALNPKEFWAGLKDVGNVIIFQPVSEETQNEVGKKRGLVNSRFEGKCRKDISQEKIKHDHAVERMEKRLNEELGLQPNHKPHTHIDSTVHEQTRMQSNKKDKNNVVSFSRDQDKQSQDWTDYATNRQEQKESEQTLAGATIQ